MTLIALTGGIGSGKSTVLAMFAELGAHVFDADQFAKQAVAPESPGLARVIEAFGSEYLTAAGELDRAKLGSLVFGSEDAKKQLEKILHPEVQRLSQAAFKRVFAADPHATVVYEIPLLVETGQHEGKWDRIVTLTAPLATRLERLETQRGIDNKTALARIANQASDEERAAVADHVIDTACDLDTLRERVAEVLKDCRAEVA
ncbi:dephospho-CoA kinase [Leucobacter sp. OH1287]|uniref:dephospho-CoA kinase n=1 Tax=Leucobacter sp. OH1287 TaxID=2491049 RepID=UPI000F5DBBB6|nr:dephospho-CoA kinase [Leucobacter sp. OH1287]RRD61870.1 dephospho-CoA kinase [Leucobacter sp. OH1287]